MVFDLQKRFICKGYESGVMRPEMCGKYARPAKLVSNRLSMFLCQKSPMRTDYTGLIQLRAHSDEFAPRRNLLMK